MSNCYKVKVGTLALNEARDVNLPQEHAAWFQTVRVEPGTYDVYAYLMVGDSTPYRIYSLSAQCEGTTISCYYGNAARDAARVGKPTTAHIILMTYGTVGEQNALLAQTTLCSALVLVEWDPEDYGWRSSPAPGRMWRFEWDAAVKIRVDEGQVCHSGATLTAQIDGSYYTIYLTWLPARYATKWHPTEPESVLAVRTSGAFSTVSEAIAWAKTSLDGAPYEIKRVTTDEIKILSSEDR